MKGQKDTLYFSISQKLYNFLSHRRDLHTTIHQRQLLPILNCDNVTTALLDHAL